MAVAFDNVGTPTATATVSGTTGLSDTSLTVSNSGNMCVMYLVSFFQQFALPSGTTAVWDSGGANQTMTLIKDAGNSNGNGCYVAVFGVIAPTTGSGLTFKISGWTGSLGVSIIGASFSGVNQTGGVTTWNHTSARTNGATSSGVSSNACTTTSIDAVIGGGSSQTANNSYTSIDGTSLGVAKTASGASSLYGNYEVGGTVSFTSTATVSPADFWAAVAVNMAGIAVAAPTNTGIQGVRETVIWWKP